jgi:glyoxylase-like metal-dependent hydrolase (beta-lactamase superfamily II)
VHKLIRCARVWQSPEWYAVGSRRLACPLDSVRMLTLQRYADVTRVRMTTWRGRAVGYDVSAYLVRGILVDTGFPHAAADFRRFVDENRLQGVVVTHWHEDHAGNAALVVARGLPVAIAPATLAQLRGGAAASIRFYRRFVWGVAPPVPPSVVPLESDSLRVIHTPGHTPDHHVVWDEERGTLFSGDLFLGVKVRATFPDEHPRQLVATLRLVADLTPERMFDAHRGPVPNPAAALRSKADWLEETVEQIEAKIRAGWRDRAIRRDVLGREAFVARVSGGEYSKLTFVRACRAGLKACELESWSL